MQDYLRWSSRDTPQRLRKRNSVSNTTVLFRQKIPFLCATIFLTNFHGNPSLMLHTSYAVWYSGLSVGTGTGRRLGF